jgi:hypothetical protein
MTAAYASKTSRHACLRSVLGSAVT